MNDAWKTADADAHQAKADALAHAYETLAGLDGMLEAVEAQAVANCMGLLRQERDRHEEAATLGRAS